MYVFVDEAGDTGVKIGKGASAIFTMVMVIVPSVEAMDELNARIATLRQDLKQPEHFEFHFKENNDTVRKAFFETVTPCTFSYSGIVVDKSKLFTPEYTDHKSFYKMVCGQLLGTAKDVLKEANIKIDESGGQQFRQELTAYLKQANNEPDTLNTIKQIKMGKSHSDNLLQMADMICGALHRAQDNTRKDAQQFKKLVQHREYSVLHIP